MAMELGEYTPLLLAIGIGAGVGVLAGGWLMTALSKFLLVIVKLGLIALVVAAGWWLWTAHQNGLPIGSAQPRYQHPAIGNDRRWEPSPPTSSDLRNDRWWEE